MHFMIAVFYKDIPMHSSKTPLDFCSSFIDLFTLVFTEHLICPDAVLGTYEIPGTPHPSGYIC